MVAFMMARSKMISLGALTHDFVVGLCLLFASGFVHELTVGALVRTTFYIPQALGLVICLRGLSLLRVQLSPSPRHASGLASLWAAQCVVCTMTALALKAEPGHAVFVYTGWSIVSACITAHFWSRSKEAFQPAS
tara:strand:+ start:856 stop:1260 length:405 start_codon:yes stop_codon:yes gene_type:complete